MPAKSIIDVEIDRDGAFQKFSETFGKYQEQLARTRPAWAAVSAETKTSAQNFDRLTAALLAQNEISRRIGAEQAAAGRSVVTQERTWAAMARDARGFAGHVKDATLSLLRWASITTVVSGLLGAGGLFGIDRLAISAGNQRRAGLGLGISPGEQRSFSANYGRLVDPDGFLTGVNQALTDVTKRVGLYGAGLGDGALRGKNTAQVAEELIPALKKLADQTPASMLAQVLQARHLDQFITLEDFQRLKNTPAAEIADYQKKYQANRRDLELTRSQQKAWQDLQVQLHFAGMSIETTFIRGLTPLAKPIGQLSESFRGLVDAFLKSPAIEGWIKDAASGLETFAKYIGTPEFKTDVEGFATGLANLVKAIAGFLGFFKAAPTDGSSAQKPAETPPGETPPGEGGWGFDWHSFKWTYQKGAHNDAAPAPQTRGNFWLRNEGGPPPARPQSAQGGYLPGGVTPAAFRTSVPGAGAVDRVAEAHDFFRAAGWSEAQTAGLLANVGAESGFRADAVNRAGGGRGAQGLAQWRGERIEKFSSLFGHEPAQGTFEEQLLFLQWELTHTEKAAGDRLRALGNTPSAAATIVNRDFERSGTSGTGRARVAEQYGQQFKDRSVTVKVQNNTGGNAHVSIAQLAA